MKFLDRLIAVIVGTLLLVAVAINMSNVAGRYLFDSPIYWAEEGMVFLQIAVVIIGAALVTRDNAHLRMDAVEHLMPRRLKRRLDIFTGVLTVVVALIVTWFSVGIVAGMIENDQRSMVSQMPLALPFSVLPLGFLLIALYALLRVIHLVRRPGDGG